LLQGEARGSDPVIGSRQAWFPETGGMTECQVIDRYALHPGTSISGPALVEERESTTVVLPGDTLRLSELGNLIIEIGGTR
jgi:N-methylhydantoinase A/oxoprolinase/acetone carboxylase beta subunit